MQEQAAVELGALEKRLQESNRFQLAFVIMCLKAVGNKRTIKRLKKLTSDDTDLEDFFFTKKMRKRRAKLIKKKRIPKLTVGTLAKNAIGLGSRFTRSWVSPSLSSALAMVSSKSQVAVKAPAAAVATPQPNARQA